MVCASRFSGLWVWSRTSDVEVNYRALFPYVRIDSSEHYSVLLSNHILLHCLSMRIPTCVLYRIINLGSSRELY
jgi:hypothetical protein